LRLDVLGYTLACLSLMSHSELRAGSLFSALLLPTLALATPVFDTFFVSVVRLINARPISQGGRDHTSHRLVMLGLSNAARFAGFMASLSGSDLLVCGVRER
jgi:UDP-GlcNAc:undecaprenyl-phosphate GlcNAc-1-phosphate transferase